MPRIIQFLMRPIFSSSRLQLWEKLGRCVSLEMAYILFKSNKYSDL